MRTYSRIIVEQSNGPWMAWFSDVPQVAMYGEWPIDAVHELLARFVEGQFDEEYLCELDHAFREYHREFIIPLLNNQRIPIESGELPFIRPTHRTTVEPTHQSFH